MISLPEMPARVARLPKSDRGYPVPWFVQWFKDGQPCATGDGEPDFRVIGRTKIWTAHSQSRCWVCGGTLGVHRIYTIGPMCVVNRVTSEPPSHRDCAEFAAQACPFLTNPREKRDRKDLPEGRSIAGIHLDRNPGAVCLYETRQAKAFKAGDGYLFRLGEPERVDWYARGRTATREEILDSIASGLPLLSALAEKDGPGEVLLLAQMTSAAMQLLPAA
jgi:hypothetical protein